MSRSLRIAGVTSSFPRHPDDPAGRFVFDLHAALRAEGHEVLTIAPATPHGSEVETNEAGTIHRVGREGRLFYGAGVEANWSPFSLTMVRELMSFVREARCHVACFEPGLVLAHWLVPAGLAIDRGSLPPGTPVLGIGHGGDLFRLRRGLAGRLLSAWLRGRFDGVLATSEEGAALARASRLAPVVEVAPMGVDASRFQGPMPDPMPGWPRDYVLGLGRLVPVKGFDVLIRAAASAGMQVVIAGEGPERAALEALAVSEGARVHFPGEIEATQVPCALRHARMLVVPSRRLEGGRTEGCPTVAMEALAAGIPIVASAVGGLPSILPIERLVPPDDPAALARALVDPPSTPLPPCFTRRDTALAVLSLARRVGWH